MYIYTCIGCIIMCAFVYVYICIYLYMTVLSVTVQPSSCKQRYNCCTGRVMNTDILTISAAQLVV